MNKIEQFESDIEKSPFHIITYTAGISLDFFAGTLARFCSRDETKKITAEFGDDFLNRDALLAYQKIITSKIPKFQRDNDKWTSEMQVSFVKNCLSGLKTSNISLYQIEGNGVNRNAFVLDGLQRITAFLRFLIGDMEFVMSNGDTVTNKELFDSNYLSSIASCHPFDVSIYTFKTELEAVEFYISFNENISHSKDDIQRAVDYRDELLLKLKNEC